MTTLCYSDFIRIEIWQFEFILRMDSSIFYYYNEIPEAGEFMKKKGLLGSQS